MNDVTSGTKGIFGWMDGWMIEGWEQHVVICCETLGDQKLTRLTRFKRSTLFGI